MKKKAAPERVAYLSQIAQASPNAELGKLYGMAMRSVAQKTVVRLNKETKALFCKKCYVPRSFKTAQWRIEDLSKRRNRPTMIVTCQCGHVYRKPLYSM